MLKQILDNIEKFCWYVSSNVNSKKYWDLLYI